MKDDRGFSLLELTVACALMGVLLAAAWMVMSAVGVMSDRISAGTFAAQESQTFEDTIGGELMQANNLKSLAGTSTTNADARAAFYDVQPREIGFYADLNHNGRPERVEYFVSGGSLMRQQAIAANTTYPYSWATSSTAQAVITTIDPTWTGPIFIYYGAGNWPPTPISSASQAASTTAVTVQIQNTSASSGQTTSYAASSTVRVQSIGSAF